MSVPTYENKVLTGDKLVTLVSLIKTAINQLDEDKLAAVDLEGELCGLLEWYQPEDERQADPEVESTAADAVRNIIEAYFRKEIGDELGIEDDPENNPGALWYPRTLIEALHSLIEGIVPTDPIGDIISELGGDPGSDTLSDAIDARMPDVSGFVTSSDVTTAISGKQDALVFNTAYNASSNKVATMADIPSVSGFQTASDVSTAISTATANFQTASDVSSAISSAVSGFQTASDVQSAITSAISGITSFGFQIVSTLPVSNISETTIYLVLKSSGGASGNIYTEYAWVKTGTDDKTGEDVYGWETLGDTAVTIETLSTAEVTTIWNDTSAM